MKPEKNVNLIMCNETICCKPDDLYIIRTMKLDTTITCSQVQYRWFCNNDDPLPTFILTPPTLTTLLEWVLLLHSDDFGEVGAKPLRIQEVEITEKTAVVKVKQDAIFVQEVGGLIQFIQLLIVAKFMEGSSVIRGRKGEERRGERERERETERQRDTERERDAVIVFYRCLKCTSPESKMSQYERLTDACAIINLSKRETEHKYMEYS